MKRFSYKISMPHPATMFFLLTMAVVFLSWIFNVYGLSVVHPQTGEELRVQSLLSSEGIRWFLRNVVTNFTGFEPLGLVIIAMFGIGVANHSGFLDACVRMGVGRRRSPRRVVAWVVVLGVLANVAGDAGYIILLPIAATMFQSVGLHPIGGILVAYVSVGCGYSANLLPTTLDSLLSSATQEVADGLPGLPASPAGPLCNYCFFAASAVLVAVLVYVLTWRSLLPSLGEYKGAAAFEGYKSLSRKERRAWRLALLVGAAYAAVILLATFSPWGILRSVNGTLMRSPFIMSILFLLSLGMGLMGLVYGLVSGRYRHDGDVIEGLVSPMRLLGSYFVIVFFASQMFACFNYSHLDKCLAVWGADLLMSVNAGSLGILLLFILFVAFVNLFWVSATSKWAFMAYIFVPVLAEAGIAPDVVQAAFRVGDSATNTLTPFMFYVPLVLAYMQYYDKRMTYGSLLRYTWRYSFFILLAWMLLFVVWYVGGLAFGL